MSGLHKFLICVLSVVVAVSLGVTVYYFARNTGETISLSSTVCYQNVGETFDVSIKQEKADKNNKPTLVSSDDETVELVSQEGLKFTFKAKKAGEAVLNIVTTNEKFNNLSCKVKVHDGSVEFPYYIRNADDLLAVNTKGVDKNYEQIANVDLSGKVFAPIAPTSANPFSGSYNGGNNKIMNATLSGNCDYAGLFGFVASTGRISNIIMSEFEFKTNSLKIGGIASVNEGIISNCAVEKANLENTNAAGYVGGVVATNNTGAKVLASSFNGNLKNGLYLGGVAAENVKAKIADCYARGVFYPSATSQMGGVVCYNTADTGYRANIVNTYSTMSNTSPSNSNVGMILFNNRNYNATSALTNDDTKANRVYGNYYATTQDYAGVYGQADQEMFTTKITQNKSSQATYKTYAINGAETTWDFNNVWAVSAAVNDGYPTLRSGVKYESSETYIPGTDTEIIDSSVITTAAQLTSLMNETDGYSLAKAYELGADIDMNGVDWTAKVLNGTLDGKGHTISNITVSHAGESGAGMFSVINGTLSNLILNNIKINVADSNIGLIAATNNGNIKNVTVNGSYDIAVENDTTLVFGGAVAVNTASINGLNVTINGNFKNAKYLGGLAGQNTGFITDSKYTGDLETTNGLYLGGLVGQNDGTLKYSTVTANSKLRVVNRSKISEKRGIFGRRVSVTYAGGVAGTSSGSILGCFVKSSGNTTIDAAYVGGIAGQSSGSINACAVDGNITLAAGYAAGLVSKMEGGVVKNSSTRATLIGSNQSAGMTNSMSNNSYIEKCYIATPFGDGANGDGKKYESNTNFRQTDGAGDVSNNCINEDVMGPHNKNSTDSWRNYPSNYTAGRFPVFWELNAPNDHLCDTDECNGTEWFGSHGWNTSAGSIWTYGNGATLKSIEELKAKESQFI